VADELHKLQAISTLAASLALVVALLLASPTNAMGDPAQVTLTGASPVCLAPSRLAELAAAARAAVVVIRPAGDTGTLEDALEISHDRRPSSSVRCGGRF
jgi:hypothetical protein